MTYSVLLATPDALVVGTASCVPGVGRIVPHVRRGVGVAVSQARGEAAIGRAILDALADGATPSAALDAALELAGSPQRRQVAAVVPDGRTAVHTGSAAHDHHDARQRAGVVICGNMLVDEGVIAAADQALQDSASRGPVHAVLDALAAAEAAGGDARGRMSAALRAEGRGLTTGLAAAIDGSLDVRVDRSVDPIDDLVQTTQTDLAYQLVGAHVAGGGPTDLDAARGWVEELTPRTPDASAAVLYCSEVIAGRFGAIAEGRRIAERVVAQRPGPAATPRTVERLWAAIERETGRAEARE